MIVIHVLLVFVVIFCALVFFTWSGCAIDDIAFIAEGYNFAKYCTYFNIQYKTRMNIRHNCIYVCIMLYRTFPLMRQTFNCSLRNISNCFANSLW